jgi:hypothetical protein
MKSLIVITISMVLIVVLVSTIMFVQINSIPLYYRESAPDGTYLQKDWGSFDNQTRIWSFALCDHNYLGPLHGDWHVADGVWVPVWYTGVYPMDSRLYITLKNNIIVDVEIKSVLEYDNSFYSV